MTCVYTTCHTSIDGAEKVSSLGLDCTAMHGLFFITFAIDLQLNLFSALFIATTRT